MPKTLTRAIVAALAASAFLVMVPLAHAKLSPERQCQKGRYDALAKYVACENKALAQLFATNDLVKLQPAVSKCRVKYTETYVKLQKKAVGTGSTCDVGRFVATADDTVVDNLTGLEWSQSNFGPMAWEVAFDVIDNLNERQACSGGPTPTCFHSHCDWRLPTVVELQTILSKPFPCTTAPCIADAFTVAAAADYWTVTTLADNAGYAWGVFFGTGDVSAVSYGVKSTNNYVRIVRGGL